MTTKPKPLTFRYGAEARIVISTVAVTPKQTEAFLNAKKAHDINPLFLHKLKAQYRRGLVHGMYIGLGVCAVVMVIMQVLSWWGHKIGLH